MANIQYSNRNTPTVTHGSVEPIKIQATTQGASRSQVGMAPRAPNSPLVEQSPVKPTEPSTQTITPGQEASKTLSVEDQSINAKFSALARKEKALRQKYTEFQAKEQELQQLRDEAAKSKAYRERLKSDPLDLLNEEGITYEQLVQKAVNLQNPINNDVMALQKQIKALEATLQKQQEDSQKNMQTQRQQAEKQIHLDVQELTNAPEFKPIKDMGADEAVTQLIVNTYDEDGILLTTEQAAKQVKDYLLEEAKRISSILNPTPPLEEAVKQQGVQPTQKTTVKTLSNTMTVSEAPPKNWAEKKARIVAKYSRK